MHIHKHRLPVFSKNGIDDEVREDAENGEIDEHADKKCFPQLQPYIYCFTGVVYWRIDYINGVEEISYNKIQVEEKRESPNQGNPSY